MSAVTELGPEHGLQLPLLLLPLLLIKVRLQHYYNVHYSLD